MIQQIQLYDLRERRLSVQSGFQLNANGRFARLHQWLWNKALKAGIVQPHFEEDIKYRRVLLDTRAPLPEAIMQAIDAVHGFRETPKEVLMGPATFRELMNSPAVRDTDMFTMRVDLQTNRTIFGVDLVVLPWMEGLLVR